MLYACARLSSPLTLSSYTHVMLFRYLRTSFSFHLKSFFEQIETVHVFFIISPCSNRTSLLKAYGTIALFSHRIRVAFATIGNFFFFSYSDLAMV